MECRSCGKQIESRGKYCPNCGKKVKGTNFLPILMTLAIISLSAFGFVTFKYFDPFNMDNIRAVINPSKEKAQEEKKEKINDEEKAKALPANKIPKKDQQDVSQIIDTSLKKVVTIYTEAGQGSGFLINNEGDVLTNAHVVEGSIKVKAQDSKDHEYSGTVIGYSNNTDVAVVRVPDLAGREALPLETSKNASMGEKVLALGSPLGLRNTATLGNITGVNRSFYIGNRSYENIYQMSAQIAPGSSGGPLISLKTGKVVAINSAKVVNEDAIGFSIPIKSIFTIINDWITSPLSKEELQNLFYNKDGNLYYQDEENMDDWYFDGGEYSEEDDVYYDIPEVDDNYSDEYNTDEEENSYEEEETYSEEDSYNGDDTYNEDDSTDDYSSYEEDEETYNEEIPEEYYDDSGDDDTEQIDEETDDSNEESDYEDSTDSSVNTNSDDGLMDEEQEQEY